MSAASEGYKRQDYGYAFALGNGAVCFNALALGGGFGDFTLGSCDSASCAVFFHTLARGSGSLFAGALAANSGNFEGFSGDFALCSHGAPSGHQGLDLMPKLRRRLRYRQHGSARACTFYRHAACATGLCPRDRRRPARRLRGLLRRDWQRWLSACAGRRGWWRSCTSRWL